MARLWGGLQSFIFALKGGCIVFSLPLSKSLPLRVIEVSKLRQAQFLGRTSEATSEQTELQRLTELEKLQEELKYWKFRYGDLLEMHLAWGLDCLTFLHPSGKLRCLETGRLASRGYRC